MKKAKVLSGRINLNSKVQNDNVFVETQDVNFSELTGKPTRKGLDRAIISNGKVVNIVSNSYGHLDNTKFFLPMEEALINADMRYDLRSTNKNDASFIVDYILNDPNFEINVKNGKDAIMPMMRLQSSYDGSCKTEGYFGFYRQVCSNGLTVVEGKIGFSLKKIGNIEQIVIPEIKSLVRQFMDNDYYTISNKFNTMAETPLSDVEEFVKEILELNEGKLFKFESSEKNPEPCGNARLVLDIIDRESQLLQVEPNMWIGYNAFNEVLHGKLSKNFGEQRRLDKVIFNQVFEMATN